MIMVRVLTIRTAECVHVYSLNLSHTEHSITTLPIVPV